MLSSNKHKVEEAMEVLGRYGIRLKWRKYEKLEIQSYDTAEIAKVAGLAAYDDIGVPLILEDSGIFINALNGFPGPYAAQVHSYIGHEGVLKLMAGIKDRSAYFKTVVCYAYGKGKARLFEGTVNGTITTRVHGGRGFGYDPIFIPMGHSRTFSELSIEEKNTMSHRSMALRKFAEHITGSR